MLGVQRNGARSSVALHTCAVYAATLSSGCNSCCNAAHLGTAYCGYPPVLDRFGHGRPVWVPSRSPLWVKGRTRAGRPTKSVLPSEADVQSPIEMRSTLERLAEGEIYATAAGCAMITLLQRIDAVVRQTRGSAPDDNIAVMEHEALRAVATRKPTEQEFSRQSERH